MEYVMKVDASAFQRLKSGKKRIYSLNDDKRKSIRIGDTIKFLKLPCLDEEFIADVKNIEVFKNWDDCYLKYDDEVFKERDNNIDTIIQNVYDKEYYTKIAFKENDYVVFSIEKHRVAHLNSTVCYLKNNNKVLMIKFNKKWGCVYAPPGGKFETGETPLDCIMREFYEETGLTLIRPRLQGLSYWKDSNEGIIFVYTAEDFEGNLKTDCQEGALEWIELEDLGSISQFDQNQKFISYLFQEELFEGKFLLDDKCKVLNYEIRKM